MRRSILIAAVLLTTACSKTKSGDETKQPRGVQLRLRHDAELSKDFFAQPFPLETRRGVKGTYDLTGFPNPVSYALLEFFKTELAKGLTGWGTNAGVYFAFDGALTFAPGATDTVKTRDGTAAILLVNVDPSSREYLKFTPLFSHFFRGDSAYLPVNTLALAPVPGFPLRSDTLYAAVVIGGRGITGEFATLQAPPELTKAFAGQGPWAATFAPLGKALKALKIQTDDVMAATVYRTMDVQGPLFKARDWLYASGPTGDAQLILPNTDTWAGRPLIKGTFETVRFQQGNSPFAIPGEGAFQLDSEGVPVAMGNERLRFALMLPTGTPPAGGWPIVIYAHGTGGSYTSFVDDEGWELTARGIAVAGYDQPYHGTRNPRVENCVSTCPSLYTFNFLNPPGGRDGFRQSALDAVQLTRAVLDLKFKIGGAGAEHHFDESKLYYMGHSQGSTSGPLYVAAEKNVKAAVFSGSAGGLVLSFLYKTKPFDILTAAAFILGDHEGFNLFHPILNIFQAYSEPADPINYARYVSLEPRDAETARDVLTTEGLIDDLTPPVQAEAFALALGVPFVTPVFQDLLGLKLAGLDQVAPGFSENLESVSGKKFTGGLLQFPDNGHYTIYCNVTAKDTYVDFLDTKATTGIAEINDMGSREWTLDGDNNLGCSVAGNE